MVNGPYDIWIERQGRLYETNVRFDDESHLRRIINKIVAEVGRRVDESSPMVDARLPDGSRVNIIIPPLSLSGALITIRKFTQNKLQLDDLMGERHQRLKRINALSRAGRIDTELRWTEAAPPNGARTCRAFPVSRALEPRNRSRSGCRIPRRRRWSPIGP